MTRWTQILIVTFAITALALAIWNDGDRPGQTAAFADAPQQQLATTAAVVDLDAVAKAIGKDTEITEQIEAAVQQMNERLRTAAQEMQEQLEAEQEKLGDDPTEEQVARLRQMAAKAQQNVQNNRSAAQLRRNQVRTQLIQQFREEARPIAEKVAKASGANVVLLANDNVLWYESAADITGLVITEMRAARE
ncbi:MAG: OmpH family outer membrane protein [Phycisphaeraceae bacterium]